MKRFLNILLILNMVILNGICQYVSEDITQIYTTPPTLTEFGRYEDIPVGLYTGVPEISIPLYNIQIGNHSLPISLSYHASGIKVQQRASWVGLGWSLNAGGVITRVINGKADDRHTQNHDTSHYIGLLYGEAIDTTHENYSHYDHESDVYYFNFPGYSGRFFFDDSAHIYIEDDKAYKISFTPSGDEFQAHQDMSEYEDGITSFTIVTDDGTRYTFDSCEYTLMIPTYPNLYDAPYFQVAGGCYGIGFQIFEEDIPEHTNPTAWYLTKIQYPDRVDSVTFEYESLEYSNMERTGQTRKWGTPPPWTLTQQKANPTETCVECVYNRLYYNYSLSLIDGLRLKQINWSNGSIAFNINTADRKDLDNQRYLQDTIYTPESVQDYDDEEKSLSEIIVKNNSNETVKQLHLGYDYFKDTTGYASLNNYWDKLHLFYRLRLDTVYEISSTGQLKAPYLFEYETSDSLPYRYSNAIDYWGYYNGKETNANQIPTIHVYPQAFFNGANSTPGGIDTTIFRSIFLPFKIPWYDVPKIVKYGEDNDNALFDMGKLNHSITMDYDDVWDTAIVDINPNPENKHVTLMGADRSVDTNYNQAFILKKIIYPTGGHTEFTYESNKYLLKGKEYLGPGVRIKKMATFDPVSNDTITKNYTYTNGDGMCSGKILDFPLFASNNFELVAGLFSDFSLPLQTIAYKNSETLPLLEELWKGVLDSAEVSDGSEYWIDFYLRSINPDYLILQSSSKVELGTTKGSYVYYDNVTVDYNGNGKEVYTFEPSGSIDDRTSDTIQYSQENGWINIDQDIVYFDGMTSDHYPFPPIRNSEWNRGQLDILKVFDKDENLVKKIVYNYTIDDYEPVQQIRSSSCGSSPYDHLYAYDMLSAWKYLSYQQETTYDPSDTSKHVTTISTYKHNDEHLLSRQVVLGSDGDSIKTLTFYPIDFYGVGNSPITYMQDKNIINKPIEVQVWKDDRLVSATFNKYANYQGETPLPKETYMVESDMPLDDYEFIGLDSLGDPISGTQYKRRITLDYDDATYNLISSNKENDIITSFIWGYNDDLPIAKVENASNNEICFYDAEEGEYSDFGWWNSGNGGTISPNEKFTGKKSLNLAGENRNGIANTIYAEDLDTVGKYRLSARFKNINYLTTEPPCVGFGIEHAGGSVWFYEYTANSGEWDYVEIEIDLSEYSEVEDLIIYVFNGAWGLDAQEYGEVYADQIRFYPADALMSTYTYDPLIGMTSQTDPSGISTFYEYDEFGRLTRIKDNNGYILEEYNYRYKGQQ